METRRGGKTQMKVGGGEREEEEEREEEGERERKIGRGRERVKATVRKESGTRTDATARRRNCRFRVEKLF